MLITGWYQWIVKHLIDGNIEWLYLLGKSLLELYECLTVALFFCLTWLASSSIQVIIDDVEDDSAAFHQASNLQIIKWSRSYCLVMNFIHHVNLFLELPLFIFILKEFIFLFVFLTSVVGLMDNEASHNLDLYIFQVVYLIKNTTLFAMVIIGAQNMKRKVRYRCFNLTRPVNRLLFLNCFIDFIHRKAEVLITALTTRRCFNTAIQSQVPSTLQT